MPVMFDRFVCALKFSCAQFFYGIRNLRTRGNYRGMHLVCIGVLKSEVIWVTLNLLDQSDYMYLWTRTSECVHGQKLVLQGSKYPGRGISHQIKIHSSKPATLLSAPSSKFRIFRGFFPTINTSIKYPRESLLIIAP